MSPVAAELSALARERIFDCLGTLRLRAQAAQIRCQLAHDEALDLTIKELMRDVRLILSALEELEETRLASEAAD